MAGRKLPRRGGSPAAGQRAGLPAYVPGRSDRHRRPDLHQPVLPPGGGGRGGRPAPLQRAGLRLCQRPGRLRPLRLQPQIPPPVRGGRVRGQRPEPRAAGRTDPQAPAPAGRTRHLRQRRPPQPGGPAAAEGERLRGQERPRQRGSRHPLAAKPLSDRHRHGPLPLRRPRVFPVRIRARPGRGPDRRRVPGQEQPHHRRGALRHGGRSHRTQGRRAPRNEEDP